MPQGCPKGNHDNEVNENILLPTFLWHFVCLWMFRIAAAYWKDCCNFQLPLRLATFELFLICFLQNSSS